MKYNEHLLNERIGTKMSLKVNLDVKKGTVRDITKYKLRY